MSVFSGLTCHFYRDSQSAHYPMPKNFTIQKGLSLPIAGVPEARIENAPQPARVALLGVDYVDLKPAMKIAEGEPVRRGQTLFVHKNWPQICFTSPGSGRIEAIHRGKARRLLSVVVKLNESEAAEAFPAHAASALASLPANLVYETLLSSGLWTALRTRPFSKIPAPDSKPEAIFVTLMDSNPLAGDPAAVLAQDGALEDLANGLQILSHLGGKKIWLCTTGEIAKTLPKTGKNVDIATFQGPHPSGLVGTHIHLLAPVSAQKTVWHIGYQDVIAIGKLFVSGQLSMERVIALGGPMVKNPRLLKTRLGADLNDLLKDELQTSDAEQYRVLSGSPLSGRRAHGELAFLGRYHQQISVLSEQVPRRLLGWLDPRGERLSTLNVLVSALSSRKRRFALTTSQNGSPRAMVPTGSFENLMPLDILPTQLLRSLLVGDTDMAQKLGCLELDEEDLALCSFACVGKHDYGPILRENLRQIEKEG